MSHKTFTYPIGVFLFCLTLLASSGCGKNDQDYLFEVDHAFNIQLPAGQGTISSLVIPFNNLNSLVASELAKRNLTANDVSSIQTARARIDLASFDGNLSDYQEVEVNVFTGPNPQANPYEAGYTIQIRNQQIDRIDIVPSLSNLKEVLQRNMFNMELVMRPRRISPRTMDAVFTITFGVVQ